MFDLHIQRSTRRKTLSLVVEKAQLRVMAPVGLPEEEIHHFIQQKQAWIEQKVSLQQKQLDKYQHRQLVSGDQLPCLGQNFELVVNKVTSSKVIHRQGCLYVALPARVKPDNQRDYVRRKLQQWYSDQALLWFQERVQHYCELMGLEVNSVEIKNYKAKWGSCSSRGELSFNWRLLLAPPEISDYVVVHELCHLWEMNHSPRFWQHVEVYCPSFREQRRWLKEWGGSLEL